MAKQVISRGTVANDGTGTQLRVAFGMVNDNFTELYDRAVNLKEFGAVGNGSTDDTTAWQAAIDFCESVTGAYPPAGSPKTLHVPPGNYLISGVLQIATAIRIKAMGWGAKVTTSGGFVGSTLFNMSGNAGYCSLVEFEGLQFNVGTDIACIRNPTATTMLGCMFRNLLMKCNLGIITDGYVQECIFENITFTGANKTLIQLKGNANRMIGIYRESGDGTAINNGTEPLISLLAHAGGNSYDLMMQSIVLEGYSAANKIPIKAVSFDNVTLAHYHSEAVNNGYILDLDDCSNWRNLGTIRMGLASQGKIKLRNNSSLSLDYMDTNSEDLPYTDWLDLDTSSHMKVTRLLARRWANAQPLSNVVVEEQHTTGGTTLSPPVMRVLAPAAGQNILANPSFESGFYAWGNSASLTPTFLLSEISPPGLMVQLTASVATAHQTIFQQINLTGWDATQWFTFSAWVKVVGVGGVSGANIAYALVNAISGTDPLFSSSESVCRMNTGWQRIVLRFRLGTAGSFQFGIATTCPDGASGNVTIYVDDVCLAPGMEAAQTVINAKQFELNGASMTTAAAAPTTGTWKRGDICFNSTPTLSQTPGWVCTTAGSPGTWKAMANLAA